MTRLQLKLRILGNLKDPTGVFWTDTKLNDSVQDAYDEIIQETECIEKLYTLATIPGVIYYDLYNIIYDFWKITRLYNNQTNRWISIYDQQVLNRNYYSWEKSIGTPWCAYIVNFQYLAFFPHSTSNQTFDIYYKVGKDTLVDDTQLVQIPDAFIKVMEDWCTADLLESVQEFSKAKVFWQDYILELGRFKNHVRARALPIERQILEPMTP